MVMLIKNIYSSSTRLVILVKNVYTLSIKNIYTLIENIHIYFTGSETSPSLRCKLMTEIIYPLQVDNKKQRKGIKINDKDIKITRQ